jgi:hypothetical protein
LGRGNTDGGDQGVGVGGGGVLVDIGDDLDRLVGIRAARVEVPPARTLRVFGGDPPGLGLPVVRVAECRGMSQGGAVAPARGIEREAGAEEIYQM